MGKILKTIIWIVVVVLVVWGIYSLSTRESSVDLGNEPIKIGWIGPLTGNVATWGEGMKNVFSLAIKEINNDGGIDGHELQVIYEDGKCNGKDAATAMQKLANIDQVEVVVGGFCSSESISSVPIAEQAKVFMISAGSSSPYLTGISQYFARNYPSDSSQSTILANIAYNNKNWKNIAIIQEQTDYAQALYETFEEEFESMGGTVVINEKFKVGDTDFKTSLAKIKNQNPNAVFLLTQSGPAAAQIAKQMVELSWNIPLMASDALITDTETISKNPDVLEGTIGAVFGTNPDNQKFQNLISLYQEKYGKELPYQSYAQTYYDAAFLVKEGIESVGNNGKSLAKWIRTIKDWQGAAGSVTIKENGDLKGGLSPRIIRNGEIVPYER